MVSSADILSFQTEIGEELNYTSVNISEEKSTKHLKNETERTNMRKRRKKSINIENGKTATKRCKIQDQITCVFAENVSELSMKSSEFMEPAIEAETSHPNKTCPQMKNSKNKNKSKIYDTTTCIFEDNVSLRSSMKSSEMTEPVIKRNRDLLKTTTINTNLVCPRTQNLSVTKLNKDCNPNGSFCQNKVIHSDDYSKNTSLLGN